MEEINVFVRAAALDVAPPQVQPEDLYDILPRQGKALGGQATFATSGRRITLTAATSHFPTGRPQPTPPVISTPSSLLTTLTTSVAVPTAPVIPLAPILPTAEVGSSPLPTIVPTLSPVPSQPSQPSPVQPSPIPSRVPSEQEQNGAQSPSAAPVTATPGGTDAGVIVGAILLVLVGIAILAAMFFFIKKKVNGEDKPKPRAESFDFGPPARTNPNLSKAEAAAMAELMRIAYRVENEGDGERDTAVGGGGGGSGGGGGVSYYPGVPPREKMGPNNPGVGLTTTPYEESRQADNVARMQSLGSESVAQLGLRHPVGRWVHIQKPGPVAQRTSAYDIPDMPAPNAYPDRYSTSNLYSGVAR